MTDKELRKYISRLMQVLRIAGEEDIIIREVSFIRRTGWRKELIAEDFKMLPKKLLGVKIKH